MGNNFLNKTITKHGIVILISFILFLGCSASAIHKDVDISVEELKSACCSIEHYKKDTVGYSKYQTFDEYLMQGQGHASVEPYVSVKKIADTIIVKSSSPLDSMRVYYKLPCGIWYSHMEYDMWKKEGHMPVKVEWDKPARSYDRFFYNDTILEISTAYVRAKKLPSTAIVKTRNSVFTLDNFDDIGSVNKLRSRIYSLISENSSNATRRYIVMEKQDSLFYVNGSNRYSYKKTSLGLWGIQPGIDETNIYNGQDIRHFTSAHPNGIILDNDTAIYELADDMPKYPGGIEEFNKISHITIQKQMTSADRRIKVIVECVVEKDGSLSNHKIKKGRNEEYNNKALEIARRIDRFAPAVLNGEKVRCKTIFPIIFSFSKPKE